MPPRLTIGSHTRSSTFSGAGGCDETFFSIATPEGVSFGEALAALASSYSSSLDRLGLSDATAVFGRIFLSDVLNQRSAFLESSICDRLHASCALSIIEQKPLDSGPLSLLDDR